MLVGHHHTSREQYDIGRKPAILWYVWQVYLGPEWLIYASAGFV